MRAPIISTDEAYAKSQRLIEAARLSKTQGNGHREAFVSELGKFVQMNDRFSTNVVLNDAVKALPPLISELRLLRQGASITAEELSILLNDRYNGNGGSAYLENLKRLKGHKRANDMLDYFVLDICDAVADMLAKEKRLATRKRKAAAQLQDKMLDIYQSFEVCLTLAFIGTLGTAVRP